MKNKWEQIALHWIWIYNAGSWWTQIVLKPVFSRYFLTQSLKQNAIWMIQKNKFSYVYFVSSFNIASNIRFSKDSCFCSLSSLYFYLSIIREVNARHNIYLLFACAPSIFYVKSSFFRSFYFSIFYIFCTLCKFCCSYLYLKVLRSSLFTFFIANCRV